MATIRDVHVGTVRKVEVQTDTACLHYDTLKENDLVCYVHRGEQIPFIGTEIAVYVDTDNTVVGIEYEIGGTWTAVRKVPSEVDGGPVL